MDTLTGNRRIARGLAPVLACAALLAGATALAAEHGGPHWGYGAENGPASWGKLDAGYALCASGKAQTPIDLPPPARPASPAAATADLELGRGERALTLLDN